MISRIKNVSLTFLSVLILFACTNDQVEKSDGTGSIQDEFKVYTFDINGPHTNLLELVEKAEIMRLEETEESLLSSVGKVLNVGEEYLFENGYEGNLVRYSKTGEFIGRINRQGDGPEEYGNTQSLWITNGLLSVYSKYKKTIKQYQLNGDFVTSSTIPQNADQVIPFNGGYAMDMNHAMLEDSLRFDVFLYDEEFRIDTLLIPYEEGYKGFSMSSDNNGFDQYNEGLTYIRTMSDSLFFLNNEEIRPLAKFDFGKNWVWNADVDAKTIGFERAKEGVPVVINNLAVRAHSKWLYINCLNNGGRPKSMIVNRETGEYTFMDYKIPGQDDYYLRVIKWEGDRLLVSMSSDFVEGVINQLGEERYSFTPGTTLEVIESSENPVFMRLTLRDKLPN